MIGFIWKQYTRLSKNNDLIFSLKNLHFLKLNAILNRIKIIIKSQYQFNFNEWLTQKLIKFERNEVQHFE